VLQRLARDGWLTIQHGKPTKVNNIWETSGLNILDTIVRLDDDGSLTIADQLLNARTNMSAIYLRLAVKTHAEQVLPLLDGIEDIEDTAKAWIEFDWQFHHSSTMAAGNPVYTLMLNGFKSIYYRIGEYYFTSEEARKLAKAFYGELRTIIKSGDSDKLVERLWQYGHESGVIWQEMRDKLTALSDLDED
jgi:GntR family negative regulator for fad regulon and positive regulator of fabA